MECLVLVGFVQGQKWTVVIVGLVLRQLCTDAYH